MPSGPLILCNWASSSRFRSPSPLTRPPCSDRKSTRLNSSHSQISYAVFCLKKKNPLLHDDASPRRRMQIQHSCFLHGHVTITLDVLADLAHQPLGHRTDERR